MYLACPAQAGHQDPLFNADGLFVKRWSFLHTTNIGVDNDYKNFIKTSMKAALADGWGGSMIATELQDIILGRPKPVRAKVNLGTIKADGLNCESVTF